MAFDAFAMAFSPDEQKRLDPGTCYCDRAAGPKRCIAPDVVPCSSFWVGTANYRLLQF